MYCFVFPPILPIFPSMMINSSPFFSLSSFFHRQRGGRSDRKYCYFVFNPPIPSILSTFPYMMNDQFFVISSSLLFPFFSLFFFILPQPKGKMIMADGYYFVLFFPSNSYYFFLFSLELDQFFIISSSFSSSSSSSSSFSHCFSPQKGRGYCFVFCF
jgi:hypothetical protein